MAPGMPGTGPAPGVWNEKKIEKIKNFYLVKKLI